MQSIRGRKNAWRMENHSDKPAATRTCFVVHKVVILRAAGLLVNPRLRDHCANHYATNKTWRSGRLGLIQSRKS